MAEREKPVTSTKIPGTDVPDVTRAGADTHERRFMSRVAVTTAVLAAVAAISSMFAGNHLNEAMLEQIHASDQWNYFQAKGLKRALAEDRLETAKSLGQPPSPADADRAERYHREQDQIKAEAEQHQAAAATHRARNRWLARASTAAQIAIALAAVALLLRRNVFWYLSIGLGVLAAALAGYGLRPYE